MRSSSPLSLPELRVLGLARSPSPSAGGPRTACRSSGNFGCALITRTMSTTAMAAGAGSAAPRRGRAGCGASASRDWPIRTAQDRRLRRRIAVASWGRVRARIGRSGCRRCGGAPADAESSGTAPRRARASDSGAQKSRRRGTRGAALVLVRARRSGSRSRRRAGRSRRTGSFRREAEADGETRHGQRRLVDRGAERALVDERDGAEDVLDDRVLVLDGARRAATRRPSGSRSRGARRRGTRTRGASRPPEIEALEGRHLGRVVERARPSPRRRSR